MKLTIKEANIVFEGLKALNGKQIAVEVDGKKRVVTQGYKFKGKIIYALAKNIRIFETQYKAYNQDRDKIIETISGGAKEIDPKNVEQLNQFLEQVNNLENDEVELKGVLRIKLDDLNLDENSDIQPFVIASLLSIIDE